MVFECTVLLTELTKVYVMNKYYSNQCYLGEMWKQGSVKQWLSIKIIAFGKDSLRSWLL